MKWSGICWIAIFGFAGTLLAGDSARLVYSKSFPGSTPEYMQVIVDKTGNTEYRDRPDDELPIKFKLTMAETQEVFNLAEKLEYFKHPLEAPVKVAFMGAKTFRYENGDQKTEVKFNYSQELPAQELLDWFERMAESAGHRIDLERTAKYDKLGVDKAIRLLAYAIERKRLLGLDQYLPMLDRIANNESYMHTARARAAEIAEFIRSPKQP
jgi:hypothetical protein